MYHRRLWVNIFDTDISRCINTYNRCLWYFKTTKMLQKCLQTWFILLHLALVWNVRIKSIWTHSAYAPLLLTPLITVLLTIPFNKLLCVNKSLKKMNIFQNTIEESGCFWNQNKLCYENYDFIFIYLTHFFSLPENHALPYTEYYYNHQ